MVSPEDLDGAVAVVTGAGGGIGRAEAIHLAERGAAVVVNDWTVGASEAVVNEIRSAGGRAAADNRDIAEWSEAQSLVEETIKSFGRLDILVNNAGILRSADFAAHPPALWDEVVRVCLRGHVAPARAVASWWSTQPVDRSRRVVMTTSLAGLYGASPLAAYSTAKAGVIGLTWSLSRELEALGATVNAIAPRAKTAMTSGNEAFASATDAFHPRYVAPLVGELVSAEASDVTGRVFVVGGGKVWSLAPFAVERSCTLSDLCVSWLAGSASEPVGSLPRWSDVDTLFR